MPMQHRIPHMVSIISVAWTFLVLGPVLGQFQPPGDTAKRRRPLAGTNQWQLENTMHDEAGIAANLPSRLPRQTQSTAHRVDPIVMAKPDRSQAPAAELDVVVVDQTNPTDRSDLTDRTDRSDLTNTPDRTDRRYSLVWFGLLFSVALNLFLAWITWDTSQRYHDLVDDLEELERRRSRTDRGSSRLTSSRRTSRATVGSADSAGDGLSPPTSDYAADAYGEAS